MPLRSQLVSSLPLDDRVVCHLLPRQEKGLTGTTSISDFSISGSNGIDKIQLSATNTQYAGAATAFDANIAAAAAGSTVLMSVAVGAVGAAGTAITTGTDIIKLTTSTAVTGTLQQLFNAAIGGASVTGISADGRETFFMLHDSTNNKMVIGTVDAGAGNSVIASGDVVTLIGTVDMTAANYALFTNANFIIGA